MGSDGVGDMTDIDGVQVLVVGLSLHKNLLNKQIIHLLIQVGTV